ncbi:MAG: threonine--tRNA ligase [Clostridiales bacterium]|nr:threonine--tRNA ligase [Clostridiales bacterium]
MKIRLKDGSVKEYDAPIAAIDVARDLSEGLARAACAARVDGQTRDLRFIIDKDCDVEILTFDDDDGKKAFRHTASHILAHAVKNLYPEAKLAIGPATDDGFYYDIDIDRAFKEEELPLIEAEMKKLAKKDMKLERFETSREEALSMMEKAGEPYKVELINDLPQDAVISFYRQDDFLDLCAGPHLISSRAVKAVKLIGSSGAYWRGNEKNKMLARVYGAAFTKADDLTAYIVAREEAKKRDHNKLGRELEFFTTCDIVGQGLPLFMPKGAKVLQIMQRFVEDEEERRGYKLTKTPFMAKSELYKLSGHWDHYRDSMFVMGDEEKDDDVYALRPMTCPFQYMIYNARQHSYKDLPIRYSETSSLFRNEASGEMHGLIRVRQFTISEGHLICARDQLEEEFKGVMDLIRFMTRALNIDNDIKYRFSKWDPNDRRKYIGDPDMWEKSQNIMRKLLIELNVDFTEAEGEAAFYGPKLDIQFKNVHGKEDTIITIQIDLALAERFSMTYIDRDGSKVNPFIIHRTSIGCYERTLAMLIEKYAGALPTWLSPVQAIVLPISDKYNDYARQTVATLQQRNVRAEGDFRAEKIGYKIREARNDRTPFLLIVGETERAANAVSVRSRAGEEGSAPLDEFVARITEEIASRANYTKGETPR